MSPFARLARSSSQPRSKEHLSRSIERAFRDVLRSPSNRERKKRADAKGRRNNESALLPGSPETNGWSHKLRMISGAEPRSDAGAAAGLVAVSSASSSVDTRYRVRGCGAVDLLNEHSPDHRPASFYRSIVRACRHRRGTRSLDGEIIQPRGTSRPQVCRDRIYVSPRSPQGRFAEGGGARSRARNRDSRLAAVVGHRGVFRGRPLERSPNGEPSPLCRARSTGPL